MTNEELRTKIRGMLWPSPGEPINLRVAHNTFFDEGMSELQRWVECLQANNTTIHQFCSTYVHCAKSIIELPPGVINRIYTIANDNWCDRVYYRRRRWVDVEAWAKQVLPTWENPATNAALPLVMGHRLANATADSDRGRARLGVWTIDRGRILMAPWIQSNEKVVIEWDGIKETWDDDDILDSNLWMLEVQKALRAFVKWRHYAEYHSGDRALVNDMLRDWMDARAEAMHWCTKRREERPDEVLPEDRFPTTEEITDDAVVETTPKTEWVFGNIGDYGKPTNGTNEEDVADLVKSWAPDHIVTNGDNIYSPTVDYATAVGAFYGDYITGDLNTNRFWPAIGNHDHNDPTNGIQDYLDYFTLPNNERYYDVVKGMAHFFIYHSTEGGGTEADGTDVNSKQAEWLKAKLETSTAKWKIVIIQDAPYTDSDADHPGHVPVRLPFKDWGADLVISGDTHAYERFIVDGLTYVVNGAGGGSIDTVEADDAALVGLKQFSLYGVYGAVKLTVDCDSLVGAFYDITGLVRDTFTLTK